MNRHLFRKIDIMGIELYEHQKEAIEKLKTGAILCGGVGSGKSRAALAYYLIKVCDGSVKINGQSSYSPMKNPKDLYIITTARKRDTHEWEDELLPFSLTVHKEQNPMGVNVKIDSWNNIKKYKEVTNSFFIFDEQRVVGYGAWSKNFIEIAKLNDWILLSATPGDTWLDYAPVFIANGFYRNITEFRERHVVYDRFSKYPKVKKYVNQNILVRRRNDILVYMPVERKVLHHHEQVKVSFSKERYDSVIKDPKTNTPRRWNIFKDQPIRDASELCFVYRRIVNSDISRINAIKELMKKHNKLIVFYNFDYERFMLRHFLKEKNVKLAEWSGHKHEPIPDDDKWIYIVQYTAGAEGWNCTDTNAIVFYSQNYSYKIMVQAAGRIDRINTPFSDLYFYHLESDSSIDKAIKRALNNKKNFNERSFAGFGDSREKQGV